MREVLALLVASALSVTPATIPEGACEVEDVVITWGFKESFRSYISSSIAEGSWEVSGDVGYETPSFRFTGGSGYLSPERDNGEIRFAGDIVFTGHDGILETSLANPQWVLTGQREAELVFDVTGDTMEEVSVDQTAVPFASVTWGRDDEELGVEDGLWSVEDAEVVLTEAGSEAFGTYPAGEVMDPLSIRLEVTPGCLEEGSRIWWLPGGAVALALAGAAVLWTIRRGRRSPEQGHP